MAEVIFNTLSTDTSMIAFSAGVSVVTNSKTSENSAELILKNLGVDILNREAVQLTIDHIRNSELILTMTKKHSEILAKAYPEYSEKVHSINEYVGVNGDIMDPYGGSIDVYKKTYDLLKHSIQLLFAKLKEDISIE
jgi:protein-tyrosine phosphatase